MPKTRRRSRRWEPVPGFPLEFRWQTGIWKSLFDRHIEYIKDELRRAQAEDRVIVYLSCPISSRGGGHYRTNVEIANYTARKLMMDWGTRYFVLNPCQYQLESKEGTGLIRRHAERLALEEGTEGPIDLDRLVAESPPHGGDYMRMWTKVLVEDDYLRVPEGDEETRSRCLRRRGKNLAGIFDAFYFLAPSDVRAFFAEGGAETVTAGVEQYFARQLAMDEEFRAHFVPGDPGLEERRRNDFFRFYAVRASASFSKGCHDEWNIWVTVNRLRLEDEDYGLGEQLAGYCEGMQIDPGASEGMISSGYSG